MRDELFYVGWAMVALSVVAIFVNIRGFYG